MQIFRLAEIHLNAGRSEVCRVMTAKCQSGTPGAIDLGLLPSDSMDMEMRYPIWKDPSWLPYCLAILIFFCSRVVVALGLVFSQKYLPIRARRLVCGTDLVPPIAAMGFGMVFQDRHRWLSV